MRLAGPGRAGLAGWLGGGPGWGGAGRVQLRLTGDGPTARSLKHLAQKGLSPWMAFRTDELSAVLPAGADMGARPSALERAA